MDGGFSATIELHLLWGGQKMVTVVIPDAAKRIGVLGSVLIPILQGLKVPDGQMMEFRFVVSLNERNMILHKSTCTRLEKLVRQPKH
jgi:hypothetical protein